MNLDLNLYLELNLNLNLNLNRTLSCHCSDDDLRQTISRTKVSASELHKTVEIPIPMVLYFVLLPHFESSARVWLPVHKIDSTFTPPIHGVSFRFPC